jgi:hypothetical protein
MTTARCVWCASLGHFTDEGWVHEGGTLYVQACSDCPWQGPDQKGRECPSCGCPRLRDHHAFLAASEDHGEDRIALLKAITAGEVG